MFFRGVGLPPTKTKISSTYVWMWPGKRHVIFMSNSGSTWFGQWLWGKTQWGYGERLVHGKCFPSFYAKSKSSAQQWLVGVIIPIDELIFFQRDGSTTNQVLFGGNYEIIVMIWSFMRSFPVQNHIWLEVDHIWLEVYQLLMYSRKINAVHIDIYSSYNGYQYFMRWLPVHLLFFLRHEMSPVAERVVNMSCLRSGACRDTMVPGEFHTSSSGGKCVYIYIYIWLVVWNMFYFSLY